MTTDPDTPTPLPPGDISWDGTTLTAGGIPLTPGRYAIADTGQELVVEPPAEPAEDE